MPTKRPYSTPATRIFGKETMPLRELLNALRETYCGTIGAEFMYITDPAQKRWLAGTAGEHAQPSRFNAEKKRRRILDRLTAAEGLERYCTPNTSARSGSRWKAARASSPRMDELDPACRRESGVQEIVIGMAHRGRLNVLVNTLGKMPKRSVCRVRGQARRRPARRRRQVPPGLLERHLDAGGPVHLSLAFNPSHLEIVNPVVEGSSARRAMDRRGDKNGSRCCRCWCTATRPSPARAW
jgi:2-oxoglutarate dehydrogenase E1 component